MHGPALGEGAEFDLIRTLVARWGSRARGIGDDAALITVPPGHRVVASVDTTVDGVHFRRDWLSPREIGYRAVAAAMSDLAAMAATPAGILVALAIPPDWLPLLPHVADGIGEMADDAGAAIVGGNVTRSPVFSITTTVLGTAYVPLERSGAREGNRIYVTGQFGGPRAAIEALERGEVPDESHRARFAHPVPRLREAQWLLSHGATAAVDISDGLVSDLGHLAAASALRITVELEKLPTLPGVSVSSAAASGEEYELAVAADRALNTEAFAREFGLALTEIGAAEHGAPGVHATLAGQRVAPIAGHDHFSP